MTKEQVLQLTRIVDILNSPVLAYGLRSDFLGETFPGSQYLLAWADTLRELKTICFCGQKATMNARMDSEGKRVRQGEQVVIGGNEKYTALFREHFELG